jgi:segregation and condensation protein A
MTSPVTHGDPPPEVGLLQAASPYAVKLPAFEGPLDLLLHLIRLNEVDITDIPVARIAEQYIEYIELMRELDLDMAGEYLVMAATLAWIKSRMLLPPDGQEEDSEEEDPRAELIARLVEYQRFKEAAGELGERRLLGRDVFVGQGPRPTPPSEGEREIEVGLFELLSAFRKALDTAVHSGAAHEVEVESVTVHERMIVVMEGLELREVLAFEEILQNRDGSWVSRPVAVATFLGILELTRLEALRLYQSANELGLPSGPIHLKRSENGHAIWRELIAEVM